MTETRLKLEDNCQLDTQTLGVSKEKEARPSPTLQPPETFTF